MEKRWRKSENYHKWFFCVFVCVSWEITAISTVISFHVVWSLPATPHSTHTYTHIHLFSVLLCKPYASYSLTSCGTLAFWPYFRFSLDQNSKYWPQKSVSSLFSHSEHSVVTMRITIQTIPTNPLQTIPIGGVCTISWYVGRKKITFTHNRVRTS